MKKQMKKLGIIVQRYGEEVNGGAEYHARVLAEKLVENYDVEVITNCALSYDEWKNYYSPGVSYLNNVKIIRFLNKKKNHKKFRRYRRIINKDTKFIRFLKKINIFSFVSKYFDFEPTPLDCENWIKEQGPYCPDLVDYVKNNQDNYHAFLFFTYLYYPTVETMKFVSGKSYFIPTAHDEPLLFTKPYQNIFSIPKGIIYNTESEKELVENHFKNAQKKAIVAGVGISSHVIDENKVEKNKLYDFPYFIYIGRINKAKGYDILNNYFQDFCKKTDFKYHLVFVGKNHLNQSTKFKNIHFTGFVLEDTKYKLLENSLALIIPSFYESLSLVTLEAMLHGKIVVANKKCEVLYQHILNSRSGFVFDNQDDFNRGLLEILNLTSDQKNIMINNGKKYVQENYSWDSISNKIVSFIEKS